MFKQNALITMLVCILIFATGCGASSTQVQAPSSKAEAIPVAVNNKIGNTFLNISQGQGLAAQQGEAIFYACSRQGEAGTAIYKTNQDNSQNVKLYDAPDNIQDLNVIGDWVYFVQKNSTDSFIKKIKIDGSGLENLTTINYQAAIYGITSLYSAGDRLFYDGNAGAHGGVIYTLNTDGTGFKQFLPGASAYSMGFDENWLYYLNVDSNYDTAPTTVTNKFFKIKLDGSANTEITKGDIPSSVVGSSYQSLYDKVAQAVDNKIDPNYSKSLYMIINSINTDGSWVYYKSASGLYRLKPTGLEVSKLTDKIPSCFVVVGNWIFAKADGKNPQYYKLKIDGTDLTTLSDDSQITNGNAAQVDVAASDKAMIKDVLTKYIQLTFTFDYKHADANSIYSQISQLATPKFVDGYKEGLAMDGEDEAVYKLASFKIEDVKVSGLTSNGTVMVDASNTSHGKQMSNRPIQLHFALNKVNGKWMIDGIE